MTQVRRAALIEFNGDDVDPKRAVAISLLRLQPQRESGEMRLLHRSHAFLKRRAIGVAPRLDLNDDDRLPVGGECDQVRFIVHHLEISMKNVVALLGEQPGRKPLAFAAERLQASACAPADCVPEPLKRSPHRVYRQYRTRAMVIRSSFMSLRSSATQRRFSDSM